MDVLVGLVHVDIIGLYGDLFRRTEDTQYCCLIKEIHHFAVLYYYFRY